MRDPQEGVTADGTIRTGAGRDRVPADFEPVLATVIDAFDAVAHSAAELHLYGSVATGTARVGRSDVDLVAVGMPPGWAVETGQRLSARFAGLCRGVQIGPARLGDYLEDDDEAYGNRVFLRHYCVPLAGADALRGPAAFPADARAARGFNGDIARCLARWRTGAPARSVARKTLFAAAGVVSIHDSTWTTDRGIAARRWAELEPHRAAEIATLHDWADTNSDTDAGVSQADVSAALAPGGIVAAVVDRFADTIGLWTA